MAISDQHKDYKANIKQWRKNRAVVKGSESVKALKKDVLPIPMSDELQSTDSKQYKAYIERANFVNFTGSTEEGMLGMVFRKPIHAKLPNTVEYLINNTDGGGMSLDQKARELIVDELETGRAGLLVDFPRSRAGLSKAQAQALNLQARIVLYKAEDILDWRVGTENNESILEMVKLCETYEEVSDDGLTSETKKCTRIIMLKDGRCVHDVYDESDNPITEESGVEIRRHDGSYWDKIPFVFCGAMFNDETPDKAPLTDFVDLNIAHFRNSADYEESLHLVSQPMVWMSGITQQHYETVLGGEPIVIGSRNMLMVPEGGSAGVIQIAANGMAIEAMNKKEEQMIKIGARLIEDKGGNETAEAARIRFAGQNSKLGTLVGNVQDALIQAIRFAMDFMGGDGEIELEINRDFYDKSIDPQTITAAIMLQDRGTIAKSDVRGLLREGGVIKHDRTDEDIDGEAEASVMDTL